MRVRLLLAFVIATMVFATAACSSTTVIDADAARAINQDLAENNGTGNDRATSQPDDGTEAAPTPVEVDEMTDDDPAVAEYNIETQWAELAELCRADDYRACDVLFLISQLNSDYELLGSMCNGAGPSPTGWCTEGVATGVSGLSFDESSPGLNAVAADCSDGDMMACDFLYFGSPQGGQWESFGDSCGGITDSAFPDCRTEFG